MNCEKQIKSNGLTASDLFTLHILERIFMLLSACFYRELADAF